MATVPIENDLLALFALIPGGDAAATKLAQFEQLIKDKATEGAVAATPQIQAAIEPYVIAAIAVGLGGFLMGAAALISSRRNR